MGGKGSGNRNPVGYKKSPVIGANQYDLFSEGGQAFIEEAQRKAKVQNALKEATRYWKNPTVKNDEEAKERLEEYFNHCVEDGVRPTVENLALCLGTTRMSLWEWENGVHAGPVSSYIIKNAKEVVASFDANLVISGQMNPVAYIFRAKNYYHMKDQAEYVLTQNTGAEDRPEKLIQDAAELPD